MPTPDLSILIPSRNEAFLKDTIEDILAHAKANTEIIAVLDGEWPDPQIVDHPRLRVTHSQTVIGQRAAVNLAASMSRARYVMKLDAHCSVADGFDVALIEAGDKLGPDVTQIPQMRNLQAFKRKCRACGHELYQGPSQAPCEELRDGKRVAGCGETAGFDKIRVWEPRPGTRTEFWRFDHTLHFQYWHDYKQRPAAQGDIVDVLSSVGACFFMRRERFHDLGGLDEAHGSWGQFGTEIACKAWLSGGRHVVNKKTWFAHLFRTQGGDFGFPYQMKGSDQDKARKHSQELWLNNAWPKQIRPLSWLVEKFAPVPGWHDPANAAVLQKVVEDGAAFERKGLSRAVSYTVARNAELREESVAAAQPDPTVAPPEPEPTKGLAYYSDKRGDGRILGAVLAQLFRAAAGRPVVSVTLGKVQLPAGAERVTSLVPRACKGCGRVEWDRTRLKKCPGCGAADPFATLERGYLTMFRQQLAALEALETDYAFMCEHDVLYHPTHFDFVPPRGDTFYYNQHVWRVHATDGQALFYRCNQVSGLCASRALLVEHYRQRVAYVEANGFQRSIGFEAGGNRQSRALFGEVPVETWMSPVPNVDIKTADCLTPWRDNMDQFRTKPASLDLADGVPGWGQTKGRFAAFLTDVLVYGEAAK